MKDIWPRLTLRIGFSFAPLSLLLFLIACGNSSLKSIENSARLYKQCELHQILPNECTDEEKGLTVAKLKATQDGVSLEKISASVELGELQINGDIANSPFRRITRAFVRFGIKPEEDNFSPYKIKCPELNNNPDITDSNSMSKFMTATKYFLGERDRYHLAAWIPMPADRRIQVVLLKALKPCMPKRYEDISDTFPILTENQKTQLMSSSKGNGVTAYEFNLKVNVFDNYEDAKTLME